VKVAHFDCFSGISGDMALGALIDLGVSADAIRTALDSLGLPIKMKVEKVRKGGFAATFVEIEAQDEKSHRHLPQVETIINRGSLTPKQRDVALRIFRRIAEAEAKVHGIALEKVHFHEVGALDSIADIVGAAVGLDLLGVERFTSGPVATGYGTVKCAHGLMPVPAPATAELLSGVPLRATPIEAELTTPTGAAILTSVVNEWVTAPTLTIERVGLGAGKRNLSEQPNVLRVFLGETAVASGLTGVETDQVWVLETNLDDLSAEVIGYCYDSLFAAGAVDVWTAPIFMKKNRPAVMLSVLAPESAISALEEVLFRETTTLGVRRYPATRHKLHREPRTVTTLFGPVKGKLAWREGRPPVFSPEYDDCARIARENGIALKNVIAAAERAYEG
jgi:uncharacterized protein (TIGR00299 family) protein